MKRKKFVISAFTVMLIALLVMCIYYFGVRERPVKVPVEPEKLLTFAASKDFSRLSFSEQEKCMQTIRENGIRPDSLPESDRKIMRENMHKMMEAKRRKEMKEYFALPPEKRAEYLDKLMAEMKERMKQGPPPDAPGGGDRPKGPPSADEIRKHLETSSPEDRAMFAQFMADMRARGGGSPGPR